jgi:ATP-dependent DNA helicase Rep
LTISWCERRKQGKTWMMREPSRFIAEMGSVALTTAAQGAMMPDTTTAIARAAGLRAMLAGNNKI